MFRHYYFRVKFYSVFKRGKWWLFPQKIEAEITELIFSFLRIQARILILLLFCFYLSKIYNPFLVLSLHILVNWRSLILIISQWDRSWLNWANLFSFENPSRYSDPSSLMKLGGYLVILSWALKAIFCKYLGKKKNVNWS